MRWVVVVALLSAACGRVGFDVAAGLRDGVPSSDADAAPPASGLIGWWMADAPGNVCAGGSCADGMFVDSLADQLGAGHTMEQPVATIRPTYVGSCRAGKPCVRFASGQYLSTPAPLASVDEWTTVIIMRVIDCPGRQFCPVVIDGTDVHIEGVYVFQDTKRVGIDASDAPFLVAYGASSLPTTDLSYTTVTRGAANLYNVFVNGMFDGGGTYPAPKVGDSFSHLARDADTTQGFIFVGDLAEVLIYDHVLSDLDRDTAEAYVRVKYAF